MKTSRVAASLTDAGSASIEAGAKGLFLPGVSVRLHLGAQLRSAGCVMSSGGGVGRETCRWAFQRGAKHGAEQRTRVSGTLCEGMDARNGSGSNVRKQESPPLLLWDIIMKANNNGLHAKDQFMPLIKCPGFEVMAETTLVFLDRVSQVLVQGLIQTQHPVNIY